MLVLTMTTGILCSILLFTVEIQITNALAITRLSLRNPKLSTRWTDFDMQLLATPDAWGGDLATEATAAAELVCTAVRLCQQVQQELAIARGDDSLGTTVSSSSAAKGSGASDVKVDGTPVTAADFAIQAYIASKLAEQFPNDRFMGEEDASDLRDDAMLLQTTKTMAIKMMGTEALEDACMLEAIDRGVEPPRGQNERIWILDPIDGTKGLITGKQYIVGLALTVEGKVVVAVMGNPSVNPEVMVAVKGHGLRYWSTQGNSCVEMPRSIPNNWHLKCYDFSKLVPDVGGADFGWGSGSAVSRSDYPPYLLSRPMSGGSPLPFGPLCPPQEICCGAQVKYFAVARGDVAGFIQFQRSLKSWDHAPGVLCVQESGGMALDAAGNEIIFADREFSVEKGIVCCAAEASQMIQQRLMACVQQTDFLV